MAYSVQRILGIDPGIERLGWGLIEKTPRGIERLASGVKRTLKTKRESERLLEIYEFLDALMQKEKPGVLATEKLFFSKNVKTALIIGEVRGLILALGAKHSLTLKEFAPLEVKLAVCGYGRAEKTSVAHMVRLMLQLPQNKLLDDETDALALAIAASAISTFP